MPADDPLGQPVQFLKGVGPARADQLKRLGIATVRDLLYHLPRSYEDLTDVRAFDALTAGQVQTVHGEVVEIDGRSLADGRRVVSVVVSDGRRVVEGVWFNQVRVAGRFRYGQRVAFSGKPKWYQDRWQMTNPRVRDLDGADGDGSPGVVPVYPLTEDLHGEQLRAILRPVVEQYAGLIPEVLPEELRRRHRLPDVVQAFRDAHFPPDVKAAAAARRRFLYADLLVLQLGLALRRRELRDRQRAPVLTVTPAIDERIRRLFPFRLTSDQERAVAEVCKDLASERPMQRLLQADVGAGKTAVAVYALLVAVANKHQAALMAPTEVLARQHWTTLEGYLAHSRVSRLLLTGGLTARERTAARDAIRQGEVDLVVGTQALAQEAVEFAKLGLVVIDEQHRFGVNQRAKLRRLGADPHYLVMTDTPIPRTVALTVFGDLDVSLIRQLPPGRQPVRTRLVAEAGREGVYDRVREGLRQGRQAFVVCPLVEESAALDVTAATGAYEELRAGPFRDFRVGLLHGRMDEEARANVMGRFRAGEVDLLVSTSVVEVGIDVPNATLLVVEHAERFGLSQLHQLRGRVSRGTVGGECFLFAQPANDEARERLRLVARVSDGFRLAEEDARLRGVGEFFGTRQHGVGELSYAELVSNSELLRSARRDAFELVAADPGLSRPEYTGLRRAVLDRYGDTLELVEVG
jgi:ATP-dependent DNA helicase RecG